jgi:ethanolaminephosphotransferase
MALMVNVLPCVYLLLVFGPDYDNEISAMMCYTIGISYMIYIILDNCDGKQARRTGQSSPLGMLFDHGCDAIVAVINSTLLQRMFCAGENPYHLLTMMIAIFPFYFVTLEHHYTGEMNFPEINGVDEASIVILALSIITGLCGNVNLWKHVVHIPILNVDAEAKDILLKIV